MKKILFLLIFTGNLTAQTFQSSTNPYYWKNKLGPKSEYWQQDIDYTIDAYLDEKNEIIRGKEKIVYTNNSPHELTHLFFNLYQNAFIKKSYLSNLQEANGETIRYGKWESEGKGNEILSITVNGQPVKTESDGSILKAFLNVPMSPLSKIEIAIEFNTYYSKGGATRRRMKSFLHQGVRHFNGAHWYPRLAVYDRKFGWCTDQHLNREFYGDFGNYRVKLNMPADFVVEATGVLQNRKEVLPDTLRQQLDIRNYWNRKWDTSVTFKYLMQKGERKTWEYLGENVHDFAWIAGPHYRLDEKLNGGVSVVAMVLEPHASGWKNACDYTQKVISVYSRDFGKYAYPKMVVADCYDGMEYPMLTMDGGADPGYRGLLAHEVGHNWFYGMVNNNETYRAMLDEGFTQFLTAWSMEAIDGSNLPEDKPKQPYLCKHYEHTKVRDSRVYNGYLSDAMDHHPTEINVHSDGYSGATGQGGGYRHVYVKTATMLYNLQYVLGDTLFLNAMKYYFNQWSFRHPYIEDFRSSIIEYTKSDLNWFFDQWIETSKTIDYKVHKLKKISPYYYQLSLTRKQDMQMPLDITVEGASGKKYNFYIPNTWWQKNTNATVLPRWIGWDSKLKTEYQTLISLPEPPKLVTIDTSDRLADINLLNNTTTFPMKWKFDSKTSRPADHKNYTVLWRPDIWYNNFDGIKLGVHTEGSLFRSHHQASLDFWVNTGLGKWAIRDKVDEAITPGLVPLRDLFSIRATYETPIHQWMKETRLRMELRHLDGVALGIFKLIKRTGDYTVLSLGGKSMTRYRAAQSHYDYQPVMQWRSPSGVNTSIILDLTNTKPIFDKINQQTNLRLRTSLFSKANYSYVELDHREQIRTSKLNFKWRIFARLGMHNTALQPIESMLNTGGASGEEMLDNEFMRSVTAFPQSFTPRYAAPAATAAHLHYSGGVNLRGYTFSTHILDNGRLYPSYAQNSGASINAQINFEQLSPIKFRKLAQTIGIGTYLFGDAGSVTNFELQNVSLSRSPLLSDAGVGASLTIRKFGVLQGIRPLTFRFDMPLLLSHPYPSEATFQWRWMVGIDHAF